MAVTTEINRTAELTTDGAETEFDFGMLIHADSEVQVWYEVAGGDYALLTLGTNYTVSFTEDGGTVTTIGVDSPYAAGKLLIIRHIELTQKTNWLYNDNHSEPQHQDDFDRSSMRDLQIQELLDRAVGFAITSPTTGIEFPEPSAGEYIAWNDAGTALQNRAALTSLDYTDGNFIVGDGTNWIVESGNTARTSLGLGTGDSPTFLGLTIGSTTAHDPTLTFASEGTDGTISWEDVGDYFKISTDVNIDGFLNTENLYLSGAVPSINFGGDNDLVFAANTYDWYIGGNLEYSFSATEFDVQDNNITTSGTLDCGVITQSGTTLALTYHPLTTIGIADNNLLEVDGTPNSGEFARFTANGLEGRTIAEIGAEGVLLADGTVALAGAWSMGSQNLTNVNIDSGTVDGITTLGLANSVDVGNVTMTMNGLTIDGTFTDGTATIVGGVGTFGTVSVARLSMNDRTLSGTSHIYFESPFGFLFDWDEIGALIMGELGFEYRGEINTDFDITLLGTGKFNLTGPAEISSNLKVGGYLTVEDLNFKISKSGGIYILDFDVSDEDSNNFQIKSGEEQHMFFKGDTYETRIGSETHYQNFENDGDTYWVGAGAGLLRGYCYGDHINWTQANAAQNTWYNIADADMASGQLNEVTHDGNGLLTVARAGVYLVGFSVSYEVDSANVHIELGVEIDGAAPAADSPHAHTTSKFSNQEQHNGTPLVPIVLAAGQTIQVAIRTTEVGTPDFIVHNVHLSCAQVGGT